MLWYVTVGLGMLLVHAPLWWVILALDSERERERALLDSYSTLWIVMWLVCTFMTMGLWGFYQGYLLWQIMLLNLGHTLLLVLLLALPKAANLPPGAQGVRSHLDLGTLGGAAVMLFFLSVATQKATGIYEGPVLTEGTIQRVETTSTARKYTTNWVVVNDLRMEVHHDSWWRSLRKGRRVSFIYAASLFGGGQAFPPDGGLADLTPEVGVYLAFIIALYGGVSLVAIPLPLLARRDDSLFSWFIPVTKETPVPDNSTELAAAMARVRASPKNAQAWYLLGKHLEKQGQLQKAWECYDRAVRLDPALEAAQTGRVRLIDHA